MSSLSFLLLNLCFKYFFIIIISLQKTLYIYIYICFSAIHATLRKKIKDWLARNQDNMSEWGDMTLRGLLFQ